MARRVIPRPAGGGLGRAAGSGESAARRRRDGGGEGREIEGGTGAPQRSARPAHDIMVQCRKQLTMLPEKSFDEIEELIFLLPVRLRVTKALGGDSRS